MPLLPERLLPSRLDSWLSRLGDFSVVESAEPLKPPRRLLTSSLFRPRREIELALLNTLLNALTGGEATGEAVGESIVYTGDAEGMGLCAPCSRNYAGVRIGDDAATSGMLGKHALRSVVPCPERASSGLGIVEVGRRRVGTGVFRNERV